MIIQLSLLFQNIPPDLSQCVFVIEQALSVRALQELVTAAGSETVSLNLSVQQTKEESTDHLKLLRMLHMGNTCCQICYTETISLLRLYLDKQIKYSTYYSIFP
jgi:hypothetical protein